MKTSEMKSRRWKIGFPAAVLLLCLRFLSQAQSDLSHKPETPLDEFKPEYSFIILGGIFFTGIVGFYLLNRPGKRKNAKNQQARRLSSGAFAPAMRSGAKGRKKEITPQPKKAA